jgi:F0F1-type ATP synthase membrane subunit b/b'
MRDELNRLRKINMDYEDEIARLRSEIAKINERMRNFAIEMETKDHEMQNLSELVNRRKQEVLSTQQENDRLMNMLRNMTDQKDTVDAQKLMTEEKYMVVAL